MLNCHGLFRAQEIWFLFDNAKFKNRRLEMGVCPFCDNKIFCLFETEKETGFIRFERARDKKAKRMYEKYKSEIDYKRSDILKGSKSNMAYVYGKNELHTINGKHVIFQKSVDFNGTEKVVKRIIV